MRIALVVCACVVAVGCGSVATGPDAGGDDAGDDAPPPDDGAQSGTRLKLKWIDFGGTRTGGTSARDTTAGFDCLPQRWDDDRYYCTPPTGSIVYTNATCTAPIAYHYRNTSCPTDPLDYFVEYEISECTEYRYRRVYRRGAAIASTAFYQVSSDGSCNGPYTDENVDFYAVGTQLGRGELAELTLETGAPGDRYAQRFFASADGARMFDRIVDTELGTTCFLETTFDDTTARCPPDGSSYGGYFADSVCDAPATIVDAACDAPDYMVQYRSSALCPEDNSPRYFNVGAEVPEAYSGGPSACGPITPDPTIAFYAAGTELALPELPRTIDAEGGRQVQLSHFTDGALPLRGYGQFDTTYGTRCYVVDAEGGGYRCVPYQGSIFLYYSEPTCTSPIEVVDVYRPDASCAEPPVPTVVTRFLGGCPQTFQFYATGAVYTGPLYYAPGDGSCLDAANDQYVRYALGAEIPTSAFATGVDVVDP